ncbi:60S ribosomal protein L18a-like protein isoform X2 [Amaranthus tricolor]|uniref:60S ribosomal protein L18a-like protein isoform X2 n=1 Tax=Amaranthus tricolor TaxID=29722 RepID=UPI0025884331|nr:60S ribosomal protein L18a-like protein isoform X2 [Amaranthus tricolor]XP_057535560.1 60S ribosomal protein L18a-like protein isoform X2 [Amaranthus tricolor]XP_057535561.1 60S ribosomal protein L18a-like protein isoform X2 [Amaranthus tricolor]
MKPSYQADAGKGDEGDYKLIRDEEDHFLGLYDKPLPCFGCGIGWFSFLLGFVFPPMWYYATFLYFTNYYHKDPRERIGLATSAIAALVCTVVALIVVAVILL